MFQVYEFFYGVFKVGLNIQENSPAAHCSAIQSSVIKLNLNSTEIALSKPVSVFSECWLVLKSSFSIKHQIAELQHCTIISCKVCFLMHIFVLLQMVRFVKGQIICQPTINLSFCQFPRSVRVATFISHCPNHVVHTHFPHFPILLFQLIPFGAWFSGICLMPPSGLRRNGR